MEKGAFEKLREEFPVAKRYIYLDHAGIAPMSTRVELAIEKFLKESTETAAFTYPEWMQQLQTVRDSCAQILNAGSHEIAFVRSTSHGLSLVAEGLSWHENDNVIIYEKEFPSNIYPWEHLRRKGIEVRRVRSKQGRISMKDIEEMLDEKTRLVSLSSVQFTNGFRIDLNSVGNLCRKRGILFCVDAIQSIGVIPMDVKSCHIDFLAADAHKWMLGPEGIGIFFCREQLIKKLDPPLVGWKSVKNEYNFEMPEYELKDTAQRFEEGSLNLMSIFGMGAAIGLLNEVGIDVVEACVQELGDVIIEEAEKRDFEIMTPRERSERGGSITIKGKFDPGSIRDILRERKIMVNIRGGGIRISPHFYNQKEEILRLFREIDQIRSIGH